jgi:hypothetical protein
MTGLEPMKPRSIQIYPPFDPGHHLKKTFDQSATRDSGHRLERPVAFMVPRRAKPKMRVLLLIGATLTGCDFHYHVSRPGTSDQQTKHDMFECHQLSLKPGFGMAGGVAHSSVDPDWKTYSMCLEARGYTVTRD